MVVSVFSLFWFSRTHVAYLEIPDSAHGTRMLWGYIERAQIREIRHAARGLSQPRNISNPARRLWTKTTIVLRLSARAHANTHTHTHPARITLKSVSIQDQDFVGTRQQLLRVEELHEVDADGRAERSGDVERRAERHNDALLV